MSDIVKIFDNNGSKAVSARELYKALELDPSQLQRWGRDNIINNRFAIQNIDYQCIDIEVAMPNGGFKISKDYALRLEFAKKLCMVSRSEKGEEIRDYFIECEKKLNTYQLPGTYLEALKALVVSEEQKQIAETKVSEMQPKADVYDNIVDATNLLNLNDTAKLLGIGRNKFMNTLRLKNILNYNNLPFQKLIDRKFFEVKVHCIKDGAKNFNYTQTFVTGLGLTWLTKMFKNDLPTTAPDGKLEEETIQSIKEG